MKPKIFSTILLFVLMLHTANSMVSSRHLEGSLLSENNSNAAAPPFNLPEKSVKPLRSLVDSELQDMLNNRLSANEKWRRLIKQKKIAVGLVDLRNINNVRFASINGDEMMYAASLPKIAILLAAMDAFEKGELKESGEIRKDLKLMISQSDNQASTRMIDRLGYQKIESVMKDPSYAFYDEKYGGGLWVGKRYGSAGERYPEEIKGLSHAATASQVSRYYYMLAFGKLVNTERSKQMLAIMEDPPLQHKFVNTLSTIAPKARLFRKSGTWKSYHSDSILVCDLPDRKYILVAMVNDSEGETIIRQLVRPVESVMEHLQQGKSTG